MNKALLSVYKLTRGPLIATRKIQGNSREWGIVSIPVDSNIFQEDRSYDGSTMYGCEITVFNYIVSSDDFNFQHLVLYASGDYKNKVTSHLVKRYKHNKVIHITDEVTMQLNIQEILFKEILKVIQNEAYEDIRNQIINNEKDNPNIHRLKKYESPDRLSKKFKLEDIRGI
jgi:hypothetical protein